MCSMFRLGSSAMSMSLRQSTASVLDMGSERRVLDELRGKMKLVPLGVAAGHTADSLPLGEATTDGVQFGSEETGEQGRGVNKKTARKEESAVEGAGSGEVGGQECQPDDKCRVDTQTYIA
jgi:hypothetical protein